MKIYVAETCGCGEGGTVLGVAKSIERCDKLIETYKKECFGEEEVEIEIREKAFDNIVRLYVYSESEEPIFAIREFEALE